MGAYVFVLVFELYYLFCKLYQFSWFPRCSLCSFICNFFPIKSSVVSAVFWIALFEAVLSASVAFLWNQKFFYYIYQLDLFLYFYQYSYQKIKKSRFFDIYSIKIKKSRFFDIYSISRLTWILYSSLYDYIFYIN